MSETVIPRPFPSKPDFLNRVKRLNLPVSSIVDVGVREATPELISAFPSCRHHLFEPVNLFFPAIASAYSNVDHVLHPIALSDADTSMYLTVTSLQHDGEATHSAIGSRDVPVDGRTVLSCIPLDVRRFDSLPDQFGKDFLLKIDVDGVELQVLKGFGSQLSRASVVVIEASYTTYVGRLQYLTENGFELYDIVDMVYYGDGLYQFDAAFVRRDLLSAALRPSMTQFRRDLWWPLQKG